MLTQLINSIRAKLQSLHREQGGAVALMGLAAILILFMTSMVLYDTGNWTRDKIRNQAGADTAAYSQAAVKARTMNMIAYTNVTKRSIASIYGVYYGAWLVYVAWWASRCSSCSIPWNIKACIDCVKNLPLVLAEGLTDFLQVTTSGRNTYKEELEQIEAYQKYMIGLTPWWAYLEGAVRGMRNGSTVVSSFPPPPNLALTSVPNWANQISNLLGNGSLWDQTDHEDEMPLEQSGSGICLETAPWNGIIDLAYGAEFAYNIYTQNSRSQLDAKNFGRTTAGAATGFVWCMAALGTGYKPFRLQSNAKGDGGGALFRKGNIVYSYINREEHMGWGREKFNLVPTQDYQSGMTSMELGGGFWTQSRGEFVSQGNDGPWYTSWTGRVRPVALNNEFKQADFTMNATYHDIIPFLALQSAMGLLTGFNLSSALKDFVAMEKSSRAMDNNVHRGMFK